ncbi:hypothetical protein KUH03_20265 [Sphingobacterium sp. E70]|uniref:hypothetical protein n=1 Tax=Sphingobacterium sp. E70 TaxID=2853439 RepID=UPI00211CE7AD|nr:hypothetical protein [Sphingobacterium sp. E70]ULT28627.1 hypothetical protein KUH03_20265 [Sphingobacterium sp. E70]
MMKYLRDFRHQQLWSCSIERSVGRVVYERWYENCCKRSLSNSRRSGYNGNAGRFEVPLQAIQQAKKLTVHINLKGTSYENHWNIWVYPKENQIDFADVSYTRELDEALRLLQAGKRSF